MLKYDNNATEIRGVIEFQFMGMRSHCQNIGVNKFGRIIATGGASQNKSILQVLSDVFGCDVYVAQSGPDTATKGAAMRALQAYQCWKLNRFVTFDNIVKQIGVKYVKVAEPNLKNTEIYTGLMQRRKKLEDGMERL